MRRRNLFNQFHHLGKDAFLKWREFFILERFAIGLNNKRTIPVGNISNKEAFDPFLVRTNFIDKELHVVQQLQGIFRPVSFVAHV